MQHNYARHCIITWLIPGNERLQRRRSQSKVFVKEVQVLMYRKWNKISCAWAVRRYQKHLIGSLLGVFCLSTVSIICKSHTLHCFPYFGFISPTLRNITTMLLTFHGVWIATWVTISAADQRKPASRLLNITHTVVPVTDLNTTWRDPSLFFVSVLTDANINTADWKESNIQAVSRYQKTILLGAKSSYTLSVWLFSVILPKLSQITFL